VVYINVSSHFVAKIHINHLKFLAGVFYIIENTNCVLVNCDVLICEANGNSSSLSFSTKFAFTTYNMVYFRIILITLNIHKVLIVFYR
jgi:hypothetical protein